MVRTALAYLRRHVITLGILMPVGMFLMAGVIGEARHTWKVAQFSAKPKFVHDIFVSRLRSAYSDDPAHWPTPHVDPDVDFQEISPPVLPGPVQWDSPLAKLGQALFEDPALSASGHFSCQSSHNRRPGWDDGLPRSFGHGRQESTRNAQPLLAMAGMESFFWDGRAATLAEQSLSPLQAGHEMANVDLDDVVERVASDKTYDPMFEQAYGDETITLERISEALAAFQVTLDRATRFDRFLAGNTGPLSGEAVWGLHLFRTKARCINCHMGPHLTDNKFHNIGLSYCNLKFEDLGRHDITGDPEDAGRFRTASLRHVSRTAPYMHNGLFPNLRGLVKLYAFGGGRSARDLDNADPLYPSAAHVSEHLRPLVFSPSERAALVAFLESL